MTGKLILSDGTVFLGQSFGAAFSTSGEVVFNTGMVGYPESLTDPSYYGQILVLTYPLQGNYGVPQKRFWESERIQVKGLIVQNYLDNPSHFESQKTLGQWLKEEGVPALQGIDTRALTIKLREHGVMLGRVEVKSQKLKVKSSGIYDPNSENLLPYVSTDKVLTYGHGNKHIILIDCGVKENIIRSFVKRGVRVTRMPWDSDPLQAKFDFDGIFISNGPGDPKQAKQTIQNVKVLLDKNIPTFGICLGSQILALAAGGNTYKLKFGHRGQNQPVLDQNSKKAIITSQNHGFAVDMKSLGSDWKDWFVNLNDGTNEGIRHRSKPFMAVQFHPEASPGPTDASYLFDEFLDYL
ncbi:carbamoyl phosphate synthase small subunit [Candidatus Daviesbacteria bacterium RIFCSPLOWO2_02_FULL_38_18]|nr:MAG: carbamoyl phosphate synthase small subunit [Candidatus Daviesbacteria bacterium RIFCSPHIGHO2_02_FULL_39_41]OGE45160.1 MAG: carbamoyl phosphate synthase small subunit [Candidatus Daviesbacteria bacterium RIFCSPHIGHO2_12_FULL_38_25]OGE68351.1 MAG: carbamoyl phosphate synthase small subunit [Candidatus Daviesbacteria bacterium RIFCSPLOWO2_02_FULL_38_18]OGE72148.1 MAG: carbamoyl phosphate synthase small subunit [Candidatus Daviesbacteria bacterium RIFCSPLOWO2_12_FULL_38_10]HCB22484.1 carbam